MRSLRESRRGRFPRSGDTGADGNVLVLTAKLVARVRGVRAGAIRDRVSVIVVIIVANVSIVVVIIVIAIVTVRKPRGGRACRRATTTTSTATDTTTANAVDLHHFAVDRSSRLGSTRRGRDAATDHHHQMISPPPPPRSATAPPFSRSSLHQVYPKIAPRFASDELFFNASCADLSSEIK